MAKLESNRILETRRMVCRAVFVLAFFQLGAHAAHLIELKQREVSQEEKIQLLELIQTDSGSSTEVPNIPLNV